MCLRFGLCQQGIGQFQAGFAAAGEAGEEVERAFNRAAGNPLHFIERRHHEVAPGLVGITHFVDDVLGAD